MVKKTKANFITKEWYEKLVAEQKKLKTVKLPEILERLAEAKAMWDLSENFEYKSALEDKDLVGSKLADIDDLLANAEIISSSQSKKTDGIDYGSKVTLKVEGDDDEYIVKMVWTGEVWIEWKDNLLVSFDSPMGAAIKWHKVWDVVKMRIGNDKKDVTILKVA